MKKRIIIPTLLSAALFTACVKDNESDSVKNYRDAQTEKVKAESATEKAKADLAKADAALREQQAEYQKQLAAVQKAAAEASAMTNEKTKASLEAEIANAKVLVEQQKLQAELTLATTKANLATVQQTTKSALITKYTSELSTLNTYKNSLANAEIALITLKNNVNTANAAAEDIANKESQVKALKAGLKVLTDKSQSLDQTRVDYQTKTQELVTLTKEETLALDEYNTANGKQNANTLVESIDNTEFGKFLGNTRSPLFYLTSLNYYVYIGDYIENIRHHDYTLGQSVITNDNNKNKVSLEVKEGEYAYSYDTYKTLTTKSLNSLTREIARIKTELLPGLEQTLKTATEELNTKKTATTKAYNAWLTAPAAEKQAKYDAYNTAVTEEQTAQTDYNDAKNSLDEQKEGLAKIEKCLAYLNDLSPVNNLITAYNAHKESLKTLYFAKEKAAAAKDAKQAEVNALNAKLTATDVTAQIQNLKDNIASLENQISRLKENVTNRTTLQTLKEKEIEELKANITKQEAVVAALKAEVEK